MNLTAENVEEVFMDCLFGDEEAGRERAVIVEGVVGKFGFHPDRLALRAPAIRAMLDELPTGFSQGWSFLNACQRADGSQWGEHRNVEQLLTLGIAAGHAIWLGGREMWQYFPGGLPYVMVDTGTDFRARPEIVGERLARNRAEPAADETVLKSEEI